MLSPMYFNIFTDISMYLYINRIISTIEISNGYIGK